MALALVAGAAVGAAQLWSALQVTGVLEPLKSAASPWIIVAFAVACTAGRRGEAVRLGVVSFLALVAGYYVAEAARGWSVSPHQLVQWTVLSFVAGPIIGLAGHVAREVPAQAAAATGVIGGALIGEAIYNLLRLQYSTPRPFWWWQLVIGALAGLCSALWRRPRSARDGLRAFTLYVAATSAAAVVTAGAFAFM